MYCKECGYEMSDGDFCANCGASPTVLENRNYAGFWIRFVASSIDGIILGIPMFIIASIVGVFSFFSTYETSSEYSSAYDETFMIIDIFIYIAAFMFSTMYYAGMHASKWQGTLGKIIVGIKVTDLSGQRISFARALGRYFATILSGSILYIGYIMAAFTQKKQSLHDVIARTMVVYKK